MRVVVLGAGLVGGAIARDLAADGAFEVTVADRDEGALARLSGVPRIEPRRVDLADAGLLRNAVAAHDLVVGAVPGRMGYATLQTLLQCGRPVVDISFFPEDALALDPTARAAGVCAIVDCGIAPGCSNLILGRMEKEFDAIERFACYVGGLPTVRTWPWEYKAPFSPSDVLEEYTRPARYVAGGRVVTMPALSEPELVEFAEIGTLEAVNTDGLRTLLTTVSVPSMVEKTLRYPGHAERIRVLRESGFFRTDHVEVGDCRVRPLDLTSKLLFPLWKLGPSEEDFTAMRVVVEGVAGGVRVRETFELLDRYDEATGTTSMARTTGYTCTAAVRLVAAGLYDRPGVWPPEFLGREPACFEFMMGDLASRGVRFRRTTEMLGEAPSQLSLPATV